MRTDVRWEEPMEETQRQRKPTKNGRAGPELKVVGIDCNPGPDAQDRLRRLFTLLVKLAAKDRPDSVEEGSPSEDRTGAEG